MLLLVPSRIPPNSLHLIAPLTTADVIAPVAVVRTYVTNNGSVVLDLIRHETPNGVSTILMEKPMTRVLMAVMFGSGLTKESY